MGSNLLEVINLSWFSGLLTVLASTVLITMVMNLITLRNFYPKWLEREGYGSWEKKNWSRLLTWSSIAATVIGATVYILASVHPSVGSPIAAGCLLAVATYFLVLTAQIDYIFHLVPREITNLGLVVSAVMCAAFIGIGERLLESAGSPSQLTLTLQHLLIHQAGIGLMFVALLIVPRALGFADIKMFWITGFFLVWYLGVPFIVTAAFLTVVVLFIALVTQKVAKLITKKKTKVGLPVLPAYAFSVLAVALLAFSQINLVELLWVGSIEYVEV